MNNYKIKVKCKLKKLLKWKFKLKTASKLLKIKKHK